MITYAADSHVCTASCTSTPAADHVPGELRDIIEWDTGKFLGRIPQVAHTYSVVGNMNEHQVSVGENHLRRPAGASGSWRHRLRQPDVHPRSSAGRPPRGDQGDDELAMEHGFSSDGESFSIAIRTRPGSWT